MSAQPSRRPHRRVGADRGRPPLVVALGTVFGDTSIEERVLGPLGADVRASPAVHGPDIVADARDADVVLAGSRPTLDAATIEGLTCAGIVRYGVGVERIDVAAAAARGCWVANVPRYGGESVAVHAVTLVLALLRRVVEADRMVRTGTWNLGALWPMRLPSSLDAGVVGYGRIGRLVAGLLGGLGFRVHVHDPFVDVPADGDLTGHDTLAGLLRACDVVTLHTPGRPDGAPLLDDAALGNLRVGSVLVNTARGTLIDEAALVRGLRSGRPALAGLDVFAVEPTDGAAFADVASQVLLTPHLAWYAEESEADLRTQAAQEAARILRGEPPRNVVAAPAGAAFGYETGG